MRAHPFRVAPRQVIVHGDDVHAAPGQRVQTRGKRGDQRFSFAGFHFRDFAFVQNDAADQLHIEMAHLQETPARFAHQRKRGNNRRLQCLLHQFAESGFRGIGVFQPLLHLALQLNKTQLQVFIGKRLHLRFQRVDGGDDRLQLLYVALVLGADKARDYSIQYLCCFHVLVRRFLTVFCVPYGIALHSGYSRLCPNILF